MMSRVTGSSSSSGWTQDPAYLMRFAFGPWGPGPASGPHPGMTTGHPQHHGPPVVHPPPPGSVGSTARGSVMTVDANTHHYNHGGGHHPQSGWTGQSPGPFGILPHQESPRSSSVTPSSVVPSSLTHNHPQGHHHPHQTASSSSTSSHPMYALHGSSGPPPQSSSSCSSGKACKQNPSTASSNQIANHAFHHQPPPSSGPTPDQYLSLMMNEASSYSRYMSSQHLLGMTASSANSSRSSNACPSNTSGSSTGSSSRGSSSMHHQNHLHQYPPSMNPFPPPDRLTRELMSAAAYASSVGPQMHPSMSHQQTMHVMHQQQMQQQTQQHHSMMADACAAGFSWYPGITSGRHMSHAGNPLTNQRNGNTLCPANNSASFPASWMTYPPPPGNFPPGSKGYPSSGSNHNHYSNSNNSHHHHNGNQSNNHGMSQTPSQSNPFNSYLSNCGVNAGTNPLMQNQSSPNNQSHHHRHQTRGQNDQSVSCYSQSAPGSVAGSPAAATVGLHLGINGNSNGSGSRCSSVASNHAASGMSIQTDNAVNGASSSSSSCSFSGYNSPAAGRAFNSSHTPTPSVASGGIDSNTCQTNNGASSSYPVMASSVVNNNANQGQQQTTQQMQSRVSPTSSGYPTPPSANNTIGAVSNGCNGDDSSHGLQSHFPLTPQSGSSYYSSSSGYSSGGNSSKETVVGNGSSSSSSSSSCMIASSSYGVHPGEAGVQQPSVGPAVSITGGETDPTLDPSVYTEQEIDFPSISYGSSDHQSQQQQQQQTSESSVSGSNNNVGVTTGTGNFLNNNCNKTNNNREKKKKEGKSKKDKKKKEKAKQVAAADRLALASFPSSFDPSMTTGLVSPFGPPLMNMHHPHNLPFAPLHPTSSLIDSVIPPINPYAMGLTHPPPHLLPPPVAPVHQHHHPVVALNNNNNNNSNFRSQNHVAPGGQHDSQMIPVESSQTVAPTTIPSNPSAPDKSQVSFAELEDDLRLLTEGSNNAANNNPNAASSTSSNMNELPLNNSLNSSCDQNVVQQSQEWIGHPTTTGVSSVATEVDSNKLAEAEDLLAEMIKGEEEKGGAQVANTLATNAVTISIPSPPSSVSSQSSATTKVSTSTNTKSTAAGVNSQVSKKRKKKVKEEETVVNIPVSKKKKYVAIDSPEVMIITEKINKKTKTDVKEKTKSESVVVPYKTTVNGHKESKPCPVIEKVTPSASSVKKTKDLPLILPKPSKEKKPVDVALNSSKVNGSIGSTITKEVKQSVPNNKSKEQKSSVDKKSSDNKSSSSINPPSQTPGDSIIHSIPGKPSSLFERISAIPVNIIESDKSSTSKKRKNQETKGSLVKNVSHDEYEFQESPSEPARKKSKKSSNNPSPVTSASKPNPTAPVTVKKEKTTTTIPVIVPNSSKVTSSCPSKKPDVSKKEAVSVAKSPVEVKKEVKGSQSLKKEPKTSKTVSKNQTQENKEVKTSSAVATNVTPNNNVCKPSQVKPQPLKTSDNQSTGKTSSETLVSQPQPPGKSSSKGSLVSPNSKSKDKEAVSGKKVTLTASNHSSTGNNTSNSSLSTNNTPRRRSSDKKALTIKEGLMRTGDFVVSMDEMNQDLPMIWRIEGKSLLQRFEPGKQDDGLTVYTNTSSYSAWNPTVRQRYRGVDVRIMGCSRTKIVVEKLGLTKSNPTAVNQNGDPSVTEKLSKGPSSVTSSYQHQENFEVYIQTLVSQALDPNFIAEIVKENDEYFLSNVQAIDDICSKKKNKFFSKIKWDANITKCIESFPDVSVVPQKNEHDLRCRLCQENWSTNMFSFTGDTYDPLTLETRDPSDVSVKQTKYASCDSCKLRVLSFSRLHHSKFNFFLKCQRKVEEMRSKDDSKESHIILEECLQDNDWIEILFKELELIWFNCDQIR